MVRRTDKSLKRTRQSKRLRYKMPLLHWLAFAFLFVNSLFDVTHMCSVISIAIYGLLSTLHGRPALLQENILSNICLTTDLDLFMHMNNARYLRDCDIARIKLWAQSGVWLVLRKLGGSLTLGGSTVRYRKEINLFTTYDIKTKILYWDTKAFYLEQKFVRRSDRFVCCVVIAKQTVVGLTTDQVINGLTYPVVKPECPPELAKWIEYNDLSSEKMRKES